jgi:hypothetical protein
MVRHATDARRRLKLSVIKPAVSSVKLRSRLARDSAAR